MARTNAVNFSGGLQFPMANAATDLFKKEDVQTLALAVDGHDHSAGKGLVLPANLIGTTQIADGSITLAKHAANSVDSSKIVDATIVSGDIAANTIATGNIATDAVSVLAAFAQLASNQTTSTSMVAIPGTSVTLTGTGGDLIVWWAIPVYNVTGANACSIGLKLDATAIQVVTFANLAGGQGTSQLSGVLAYTGQLAGSHTVAMYWSTVAGTVAQQPAALTSLVLKERRR